MKNFNVIDLPLERASLIEASAGTGKTYAITSLYVRMIVENENLKPDNILVVTFTNAATEELKGRIRKRLKDARNALLSGSSDDPFLVLLLSEKNLSFPGRSEALQRVEHALNSFDFASVSTIHAFCSNVLNENPFESGVDYDAELVSDEKVILKKIADDFWRGEFFSEKSKLLPLAVKEKWTPDTLAYFLKGKMHKETITLSPELSTEDISVIFQKVEEIYLKLCSLWSSEKSAISDMLLNFPGFDQRRLSEAALVKLLYQIENYVASQSAFEPADFIAKLTATKINASCKKGFTPPVHHFFDTCDELSEIMKVVVPAFLTRIIHYSRDSFEKYKLKNNILTFDDLLVSLYSALYSVHGDLLAETLRERYKAALIDEFQDTDQLQFNIFKKIFIDAGYPIYLVGDPKQAIYSFRGADIYAYLKAAEDVPEDHRQSMGLNWRSSKAVVDGVNSIFSYPKKLPFLLDKLDFHKVDVPSAEEKVPKELKLEGFNESPLQIWFFKSEDGVKKINSYAANPLIVKAVTGEIARLLEKGDSGGAFIDDKPLEASDIAVIVRGHKQAKLIYKSLKSHGIPAVMRSDESVFATDEAMEMQSVLSALSATGKISELRGALINSIFGWDALKISRTLDPAGDKEFESILERVEEYRIVWLKHGFMRMFRCLLEREGVRRRVLALRGGERYMTNLLHLAELIHAEESAGKLISPESTYTWFRNRTSGLIEGDVEQIRLESDDKCVRILTAHISKGLEFPVVFLPFTWGGVLPQGKTVLSHEGYDLVADFGSEKFNERKERAINESLAENIRLLYVALTRAKYRNYLVWGKFNNAESSALAWVLHGNDISEDKPLCSGLSDCFSKLTDNDLIARLEELKGESGSINLEYYPVDQPDTHYFPSRLNNEKLACRIMTKEINSSWGIASFTSLASGYSAHPEEPERDSFHTDQNDPADVSEGYSVFTFPRGAQAGTFLHSLLEKIDFSSISDSKVEAETVKALNSFGYDENYASAISKMVLDVAGTKLYGNFSLSDLEKGGWVSEMEFYLPLKPLSSRILAGFPDFTALSDVDYTTLFKNLDFREVKGMLLGFIDMVFELAGKYFIIDWKSNHLGNRTQDYSRKKLIPEMERKRYPLQYLIYCVAVDRYLAARVENYDYERHFGGVFYLFLRGVDKNSPGSGIFFEKPDKKLIERFSSMILDFTEVK